MTGFTDGCPACGAPRPRRRNYTRPATCGSPRCILSRKAAGGHASKGRRKPGNAHAWAAWRARNISEVTR